MFLSSANIYFIRKQGEKKMQFDQHIETNPKFYLISWKLLELEKANNLTITRFIQVKLTTFFLPKSFPQKTHSLWRASCVAKEVKNHFLFANTKGSTTNSALQTTFTSCSSSSWPYDGEHEWKLPVFYANHHKRIKTIIMDLWAYFQGYFAENVDSSYQTKLRGVSAMF